MVKKADDSLTELLQRWSSGDAAASEALMQQVYQQLHRIAQSQLARERANHTLQPTALVNEAFLKLADGEPIRWQDRVHFFAVSARAIRQVLIDSGRRRQAARRSGQQITLKTNVSGEGEDVVDMLALDQALDRLANLQPVQAQIVELRYFGGLTIAETALALDLSTATVERNWRAARAWLYSQLGASE